MIALTDFAAVRTFIFDVDGVFTDGDILITDDGAFLRRMSTRDGFAVKQAIKHGYTIAVISGGTSTGTANRLRMLGIEHIFFGVEEKLPVFRHYIQEHSLPSSTVLYMGDDLPDFEIMKEVFLPCCPADADPQIKAVARYISPFKGGEGCVRDVISNVLRLNGHWPF